MGEKKKTTNAIEILHRRYIGDDPERKASLQIERVNADVAQMIYDHRKQAGLTQKKLAELIGTTQSVISRLEDSDYDGHSLSMLSRIAEALNQPLSVQITSGQKNQKISDIFPTEINYHFEKILQGTLTLMGGDFEVGKVNVRHLLDKYKLFREELEKREELPESELIEYELKEVLYPLQKLEKYFDNPEKSNLEQKDARIFAEISKIKHKKIAEIANEIDTN